MTSGAGEDTEVDVSPDGRQAIYTNQQKSYSLTVRNLKSRETRELLRHRALIVHPTFSPDGETIAFFTDGALHNVPINVLQTAATWQSFTLDTSSMLAGSTVLNVSVRIFGPAAVYNGFVFLDRVSPL